MKSITVLLTLICICLLAGLGFAADPAAVVPLGSGDIAAAVVPAATVSILVWFKQNAVSILGIFLGIGETMGASPWFKGNGIIDSIVKSLKFLLSKDTKAT